MKLFNRNVLAMILVALTGACAADDGEDFVRTSEADESEPLAATAGPATGSTSDAGSITLRNPNGLYFAKILPAGAGCPAGSWNVRIAEDGEVFTATFSKYDLLLTKQDTRASKTIDCTLNITLDSPAGLSYAVTSLTYEGYTNITAGAQAEVQAYYSFSGGTIRTVNGGIIRTTKKTIAGPYNDDFVYRDDVAMRDLVYSECGRQRTLNVTTSLNLKRTQASGEGSVQMSAIEGHTEAKLVFRLGTRKCTAR